MSDEPAVPPMCPDAPAYAWRDEDRRERLGRQAVEDSRTARYPTRRAGTPLPAGPGWEDPWQT